MTASEANVQALLRLAQLLRRRFSREQGREFIVLAANGGRRPNTDDLATQQMPVLQLPGERYPT